MGVMAFKEKSTVADLHAEPLLAVNGIEVIYNHEILLLKGVWLTVAVASMA